MTRPAIFAGERRRFTENQMATSTVSDDTFEADVLKSSTPVVVDFWAEWCGPCRQIGPALEEIAKDLDGKVKIVKLNIDENQRTPSRYNVRAIPTLMIFKDGQLLATQTGALPKGRLADWISGNVGVAA
jgi:thioredoxin 1